MLHKTYPSMCIKVCSKLIVTAALCAFMQDRERKKKKEIERQTETERATH